MARFEQLELELDDARLVIPWDGRSPRSLTRMWKSRIVAELPAGGPIRNAPNQYTLFLHGGKQDGAITK